METTLLYVREGPKHKLFLCTRPAGQLEGITTKRTPIKYFERGVKELRDTCPDYFETEDEAIKAANEMGYAVK